MIELGNNLVFKEYQKMQEENLVCHLVIIFVQYYRGENLNKGFANEGLKQGASDEKNYVTCLRQFNEDSKKQLVETKAAIKQIKDDIRTLKCSLINE